jgi:hypothetical protein
VAVAELQTINFTSNQPLLRSDGAFHYQNIMQHHEGYSTYVSRNDA